MKKIITILSFSGLFLIPGFSNAQLLLGGEDKGFAFGWAAGVNFPMADLGRETSSMMPLSLFGRSDTTHMSGYAVGIQTSFHYDFYFIYRFYHRLGIIASYNEDVNTYDLNTLNSQYQPLRPSGQINASSGDNFNITQFLIGPYFNIPIDKMRKQDSLKRHSFHINPMRGNLSVEVKLMAGYTTATYPMVYYNGLTQTILLSVAPGSAFGYFIGTGLRYQLFDGIGLNLNVNYAGSTITYPNYAVSTFSGNSYGTVEHNSPIKMSIGLLQIASGFTLMF